MRRLPAFPVTSLAVLLAVLAGLTATPPTAAAGGTYGGSFDMREEVLWDGCRDYRFGVTLDIPAGSSWDLEVVATAPGGSESYHSFSYQPSTSATGSLLLCTGTDHPGVYDVEATGHWYDDNDDEYPIAFADTFTLRKPASRTTMSVDTTLDRGDAFPIRVRAREERPAGFVPCGFCKVAVQAWDGDRWVGVRGLTARTNSRGKATIRARYNGGRVKIRAVTPGRHYSGSASKAVTLR